MGFPGSSAGKESACNAGEPGLIPGLGRSTGEGISYPLQYSWLPFPGGSDGDESTCNAGDLVLIPGLGKSPGESMLLSQPDSPSPSPLLCPQMYFLCPYLYSCPANRFFSTIFLDSIYMPYYSIFVFLT